MSNVVNGRGVKRLIPPPPLHLYAIDRKKRVVTEKGDG